MGLYPYYRVPRKYPEYLEGGSQWYYRVQGYRLEFVPLLELVDVGCKPQDAYNTDPKAQYQYSSYHATLRQV